MEKIVALCRRRGFIFGSSEIYGGIGGFWDYGPDRPPTVVAPLRRGGIIQPTSDR